MMGLLEVAASTLMSAERRNEVAANNISNAVTPGYKREIAYSEVMAASSRNDYRYFTQPALPVIGTVADHSHTTLSDTGNPLDLAIAGEGFMLLRDGDRFFLSRGGQFHRDSEGMLADSQGRKVQQVGGGDLILDSDTPRIATDGAVLSEGVPLGQIALVRADSLGGDVLPNPALTEEIAMALPGLDSASLRQGMLERSNVVLSDEMVGLMRNQRMAEAGAQLVRTYDSLLGQAVATFGRRSG